METVPMSAPYNVFSMEDYYHRTTYLYLVQNQTSDIENRVNFVCDNIEALGLGNGDYPIKYQGTKYLGEIKNIKNIANDLNKYDFLPDYSVEVTIYDSIQPESEIEEILFNISQTGDPSDIDQIFGQIVKELV